MDAAAAAAAGGAGSFRTGRVQVFVLIIRFIDGVGSAELTSKTNLAISGCYRMLHGFATLIFIW